MYRSLGRGLLVAMAVFALAACGSEASVPAAQPDTGEANARDLPMAGPQVHILAFGDSLFAGYNVPAGQSYPDKLQLALRAHGVNATVANAGVSGDTTAAGAQRIGFTLDNQKEKPDLAIVELGGNDLLRGIDPAQTRDNLAQILQTLRARDIPVLIMGMRAPPNLGMGFQKSFDDLYPELARQYGARLVPFFLEPVYDRPALIQPDRVHPTAEGIEELVAETVDDVIAALPEGSQAQDR